MSVPDYGKWFISTLLLMHSGALAGLLFKASVGIQSPRDSLWWFVAGIAFAFAAGFASWCNFSHKQFDRWAHPRMSEGSLMWPKDPRVTFTAWVAITFGLASAACLLGGAAAVYWTWR
jgi:hypothetical protein